MRFLQVATFYSPYLTDFYRTRPGLADRSYAEQLDTLLADGLASVHLLASDMAPLGYEPTLVIGNALSLQRAWAREHGLPVPRVEAELPDIVRAQITYHRPDILYLLDAITYDARFLATVGWRPRMVLGWRAATIPSTTDWRGFDILLSSDAGCRKQALARGAARAEPFLPGIPMDHDARLGPTGHNAPDITFCGQLTAEHGSRVAMLEAVAAEAARRGWQARFHVANAGLTLPPALATVSAPPLYGNAMYRALREARICLNNHIDVLGGRGQNMRVFEATGSGACLLTEADPDLAPLFQPEREVATFASIGELLEKIAWYLEHPGARDALAHHGHGRCHRDHDRPGRARWLDALIRA